MNDQVLPTTQARILCVDDEPNILSALRRLLHTNGYQVLIAQSGREGLDILNSESVDLIISDMRMPEMDGAQFFEQVRVKWPDCVRILLTGYSEVQSIISAINRGEIYRYIPKPWEENDILLTVRQALERKYLLIEKRKYEILTQEQNEELKNFNANLEAKIERRTEELKRVNKKLEGNFLTLVKVFASLIELRAGRLASRSKRVADTARKIATKMELDIDLIKDIFIAGLLVDVGKLGLSDDLLNTPMDQMNDKQLELFREHPVRAEQVLMPLEDLRASAKILRSQHERVDGKGFPDGLSVNRIPIGALVLAIANDYDNWQNGTFVSKEISAEEARAIISRGVGVHYDERVFHAFTQLFTNHDDMEHRCDVASENLQV